MTYNVFVSGNQTELKDERMAVQEVIENTPIIQDFFKPFLFEDTPASSRTAASTYLEAVKNSDIYLGILGSVYGHKDENGISATEKEYDTFIEHITDGEIIILVKGDNTVVREPKIDEFFNKIRDNCVYTRFNSVEELKDEVIKSLKSFLEDEGVIRSEAFDKRINLESDLTDIDENEVKNFLEKRATHLNVEVPDAPIQDILLNILEVLRIFKGEPRPTNTGILFFSNNASNLIPQHVVKIARYKGVTGTDIIDSKEIKGPIYKVIEEAESFFKRNTRIANKIVDFKRVDIPEYPYPAIREALINAIAHRDYNRTGAQIMFSIYDNRVEISSPGSLISGLSVNELENKHETRNDKICEIFKLTKDMETFGTGIKKMKKSMEDHGLPEPEFRNEREFFVVIFYGPGDNILKLAPDIPETRVVADLKQLKLKDRQILALEKMVNNGQIFTNMLYQEEFNVSRQTASRHLKKLENLGLIYSTGKGKATKYLAKNMNEA
ncbi:MAG: ATP-binding protein [Methanobacterium sp.]